jgi:dephospho-CoA kinase
MTQTFRLGLTGGIGSGKSTVAALWGKLGAAVMDADAIARAVTAPGGSAIAAIRSTFGEDFITPEGALNRDRMRALAYAQPHAKSQLEAIIHPLVGKETDRLAAQAQANGYRCLVFDIPLLVESTRWRSKLTRVLVVDCSAATQIARVMVRSGLDRPAVEAIMATQASRERRLAAADAVIFNDGISLQSLDRQVCDLAAGLGLSFAHIKISDPLA